MIPIQLFLSEFPARAARDTWLCAQAGVQVGAAPRVRTAAVFGGQARVEQKHALRPVEPGRLVTAGIFYGQLLGAIIVVNAITIAFLSLVGAAFRMLGL